MIGMVQDLLLTLANSEKRINHIHSNFHLAYVED